MSDQLAGGLGRHTPTLVSRSPYKRGLQLTRDLLACHQHRLAGVRVRHVDRAQPRALHEARARLEHGSMPTTYSASSCGPLLWRAVPMATRRGGASSCRPTSSRSASHAGARHSRSGGSPVAAELV